MINQENIKVRVFKKKMEVCWISVIPQMSLIIKESDKIVNKNVLHFGLLHIGTKVKKTVCLKNLTNASIKIKIRRTTVTGVFTISKEKFVLKGKETEEISFVADGNNIVNKYSELIQFVRCIDFVSDLYLLCEIQNVQVHLPQSIFVFDNIKIKEPLSKQIIIRNDDDVDLCIEVMNLGSIFKIKHNKQSFVLKRNSFYTLHFYWELLYPMNIYKRIYFVVHLNKYIFYIDIICNFAISYQLSPLSMHHIYRCKHLEKKHKDILYTSYYEKVDIIDIWNFPTEFTEYVDSNEELLDQLLSINEQDIFVVPKEIEFSGYEEKDIMIINKTPIEYTCVWLDMLYADKKKEGLSFVVQPQEAPLLPFCCQRFRVKGLKTLKEKFVYEKYECMVFPSNNRNFKKCNSKTLLPPIFLYIDFVQFKIKYLCEAENKTGENLEISPMNISFLNLIEKENIHSISKIDNNTKSAQIIKFNLNNKLADEIKIYPMISCVQKDTFSNFIIFYSPKKKVVIPTEINLDYLLNGLEKRSIHLLVSHETNNVLLNKGDLDITLPFVSVRTESKRKVEIDNCASRNAICLLFKRDEDDLCEIQMEKRKQHVVDKRDGQNSYSNNKEKEKQKEEQKGDAEKKEVYTKEAPTNEVSTNEVSTNEVSTNEVSTYETGDVKETEEMAIKERENDTEGKIDNKEWDLINKEYTSLFPSPKKYNIYFFCLSSFEKRNLRFTAIGNYNQNISIPLFFISFLYIDEKDKKQKMNQLRTTVMDYFNSDDNNNNNNENENENKNENENENENNNDSFNNISSVFQNSIKYLIHINVMHCNLSLTPPLIVSNSVIVGSKYYAQVKILNNSDVKVKFQTYTIIKEINGEPCLDSLTTEEAEKYVLNNKSEDVLNALCDKYHYICFTVNRKGKYFYKFYVKAGDSMISVDIILNVIVPYFQIIDMTDLKTPQGILWKMTSADKINDILKEDISPTDKSYKENPTEIGGNMKRLFEQFQYSEFNIGVDTLHKITPLHIVLFNPLDIPIRVHINSMKEYILSCLPPFVKENEEKLSRLLFVDNAFSNFMRCLDCCEITPSTFTIKQRQTKTVSIFYTHLYVGLHNMPILIQVENGKIIPLKFSALTFPQEIPSVSLLNPKIFRKFVIDVKNEYITNIDILNNSEIDIFYKIEESKHVVILNPTGIIKKKKHISVFLAYSSLEPTIVNETLVIYTYFKHFQKHIKLNTIYVELNIESVMEDIYRNEYKKFNIFTNRYIMANVDKQIEPDYSDYIPAYSYIHAKNKKFYVTPTSISILYAPTNCIVKRIVLISNCSSSKDLKFKISNRSILPWNVLKITPEKGVLKTGEKQLLLFTFFLNDMLLDIEGNIGIKFQLIDTSVVEDKEKYIEKLPQRLDSGTILEEVYEDTRKETKLVNQLATQRKKKKPPESKLDSLTFSHAKKIVDNIQMHKYTYDNISNTILQKAIQRLYGIENEFTEENKEKEKPSIQNTTTFYFHIHIKLFTANFDNVSNETSYFSDLINTNIYPKLLYYYKYINFPIPLDGSSRGLFKRCHSVLEKLDNTVVENGEEEEDEFVEVEEAVSPSVKNMYQQRDLCCLLFSDMFEDIIEKHIKTCVGTILKINECYIQTLEHILSDNLLDILRKQTEMGARTSSECNREYSFLKPAIVSHIFSDIFSDVIKSIADKKKIIEG